MDAIEFAQTTWASLFMLVSSDDGKIRFCVDYQRLNALTIRKSYPILCMTECIAFLGDATIIITSDANSRYCWVQNGRAGSWRDRLSLTTRLIRFYTNAIQAGERSRDVSRCHARRTDESKKSVWLGSFRLYRNIVANARRAHGVCSTNIHVTG